MKSPTGYQELMIDFSIRADMLGLDETPLHKCGIDRVTDDMPERFAELHNIRRGLGDKVAGLPALEMDSPYQIPGCIG